MRADFGSVHFWGAVGPQGRRGSGHGKNKSKPRVLLVAGNETINAGNGADVIHRRALSVGPEADFRGKKRSNETHVSTTDPDARLFHPLERAIRA